ncbi:hypothetical protein CMO89_04175 [Candidatus Woesearchaeota archaeon]|nr:hypothetical protein [Candidatus Woesearchaeota archaeon]|tara:strand:+ start:302 stop:1459 length:1158 start_codon:yes stop_codon:yes gene_type:complete
MGNTKMNKAIILIMVFFSLIGIAYGESLPAFPEAYFGTITGASAGLTITANIGGTTVGSITTTHDGVYGGAGASDEKLFVCAAGESVCTSGATITFIASGTDSGSSAFTPGGITQLNLSYSAAAAAAAGSTGGAGGGSAATTETLTEIASDSYIINRLEKSLPEGWEDDNLKYSRVGDASTETFGKNTPAGIEEAIEHVTSTKAISVLQELKAGFESGEKAKAGVTRTLTVYNIENLDTGDYVYRTQITLVVTAPKDMKKIKVVEIIPKTVAKSTDDLAFTGETPEVLQKDPVVQWTIDSLKKGKSLDLSYTVKKKLSSIKSYTIAGGEEVVAAPPEEAKPPEEEEDKEDIVPPPKPKYGWLVAAAIVLIGLVGYFAYTKKKERK